MEPKIGIPEVKQWKSKYMPQTLRAKTHSLVFELAQQAWEEKGKQSSVQEAPHTGLFAVLGKAWDRK